MNKKSMLLGIIANMVILGFTAFLTPGIRVSGNLLITLFLAALAIEFVQYIFTNVFGLRGSLSSGTAGFLISAIILYLTGMLVSGFRVTILGALIGALVLGFVQSLLVGRNR